MAPSPDHDTARLAEFLRERDAPCPSCGYNLRNLTATHCPECGAPISLGVVPVRPNRAMLALLGALWSGAGAGVFCAAFVGLFVAYEGRFPLVYGGPLATRLLRGALLYLITTMFVAPLVHWRSDSLGALPPGRQRLLAWTVCLLTAGSIAAVAFIMLHES